MSLGSAAALSPNRRTVAYSCVDGDGRIGVRLWDAASEKQRVLRPAAEVSIHPDALCFSPRGRSLAVLVARPGKDTTVELWDTATGHLRHTLITYPESEPAMAFSPDERCLVTGGSDGRVCFWDTDTGRRSRRPLEIGMPLAHLAYSANGERLAVAVVPSERGRKGQIALWDVRSRQRPMPWLEVNSDKISALAVSPDGKTVAVAWGWGNTQTLQACGSRTRSRRSLRFGRSKAR